MGNNNSKSNASPHEWKASGTVGASQDLVESIQLSSETDASRARLIELHIESRVAERLKELHVKESALLHDAQQKLSKQDDSAPTESKISSRQVSKEVEELRKRLEARKQVRDLPAEVETARGEVVRCLREHDRRPLDCWEEVDRFKREVKKLEQGWVDKTAS